MASYFFILPAASAVLCVALGLFTLRKNPGHPANIGFTAGLLTLALIEAGSLLMILPGGGLPSAGIKVFLFGLSLLPATWLLFTLVFGRGRYSDLSKGQLYLILTTAAVSIGFCVLILLLPGLFVSPGDRFNETPFLFVLGPAGRYLHIYLIIGIVLNL